MKHFVIYVYKTVTADIYVIYRIYTYIYIYVYTYIYTYIYINI